MMSNRTNITVEKEIVDEQELKRLRNEAFQEASE